jgi:hypothetical protein
LVVAGYAAVGFGIWAIAAFHVTAYQQDHPNTYGQGVSKAEEPIIGDGANPSYRKDRSDIDVVRFLRGRRNMLGAHTFDLSPDYYVCPRLLCHDAVTFSYGQASVPVRKGLSLFCWCVLSGAPIQALRARLRSDRPSGT